MVVVGQFQSLTVTGVAPLIAFFCQLFVHIDGCTALFFSQIRDNHIFVAYFEGGFDNFINAFFAEHIQRNMCRRC